MKILKRTTVNQWFNEWMEVYKSRTVKRGTAETYRALYKARVEPEIGGKRLAAIERETIQGLLNSMCDRGYSKSTVELTRALLNGMFAQALRCGEIRHNPCDGLIMPRNCQRKPQAVRALSRKETDALLDAAKGSSIEPLIKLALMTGMRGGELMALRWEDVDLAGGIIHVRHTLKQAKGCRWILDEPKTASSLRDIPLIPQAAEVLENLANERLKASDKVLEQGGLETQNTEVHTPKAHKLKDETTFVFSVGGEPMVKGQLQSELAKIRERMKAADENVAYFTFHSLRHTFATRCIEAGMTPKVLQGILGHSSLAVTMDIYVSITGDERKNQMLKAASDW